MRLYGFDTVNTFKVLIMLEEIGRPYAFDPINIRAGEQHSPGFRALNPNGKVPVLVVEEEVLVESAAILMFLADRSGFGLAKTGRQRQKGLEWLMFQASTQGPLFGQLEYWVELAGDPNPEMQRHYRAICQKILVQMESRLTQTAWFDGGDYSIADIAHYAWMMRASRLGLDLSDCPHVRAWMARIDKRPAVMRATQDVIGPLPSSSSGSPRSQPD